MEFPTQMHILFSVITILYITLFALYKSCCTNVKLMYEHISILCYISLWEKAYCISVSLYFSNLQYITFCYMTVDIMGYTMHNTTQ